MVAITKPMMNRRRTARGAEGSELDRDIAYDYRRVIGRYIRRLRTDAEMTQDELGKVLGMGTTGVSALETGRSVISPDRYATLADTFGVSHEGMAKFILRYTNPWLYGMLFGVGSGDLKADLNEMASRSRGETDG